MNRGDRGMNRDRTLPTPLRDHDDTVCGVCGCLCQRRVRVYPFDVEIEVTVTYKSCWQCDEQGEELM